MREMMRAVAIGREGRELTCEISIGLGNWWDGKNKGKKSRRLPGSWLRQVTFWASGSLCLKFVGWPGMVTNSPPRFEVLWFGAAPLDALTW